MGKTLGQMEFEEFAEAKNKEAPFKLTARGLGVIPLTDEEKAERDNLVNEQTERILKEIEEVLGEETGKSSELRKILSPKISEIIEPLLRSGKKKLSMIDEITIGLTEEREIKRFLRTHGIRLRDAKDKKADKADPYIDEVLQKAIEYYDKVIAKKGSKGVNASLRQTNSVNGICKIFRTAAGKGSRHLVPQACALLRIGIVIDFVNRNNLLQLLPYAEEELKRKCGKYFNAKNGKVYFNTEGPGEIPMEVVRCEVRTKTFERVITKLLHKPKNKAEEVIDHVGMRVTTKSAVDALKYIYNAFYKPDTRIFPCISIHLDRIKQLLLDENKLLSVLNDEEEAKAIFEQLSVSTIDHSELETIKEVKGQSTENENEHSSPKYKAIHITFDLPLVVNGKQESFPIELQIVDIQSKIQNEAEAPHEKYAEDQTLAAIQRATDNNLLTEYEKEKEAQNGKSKPKRGSFKTKIVRRKSKVAQKTRRKK